jgi:general stress protein 26
MEHLPGLEEAFKKAKVVFMTTFSGDKENTRQMTNYNDSPFVKFWFPTEKDTKKVKDIIANPKILITFPSVNRKEFFEIEGEASFADPSDVEEKWEWWWLYWHPSQKDRFWFPPSKDDKRVLIYVQPKKVRLIKK